MALDLTQGKPVKMIFRFAIPMLIGNVFQQLYNTVDSIVVGRYLGKDALAATGAASPLMFLMVSVLMGLGIGMTVIVAQFYGAKLYEKLRLSISTAVIFVMGLAAVLSLVGFFSARPLLVLLRTPPGILEDSAIYLRTIFAGLITMVLYNSYTAILRGIGDSKTPLLFLIIASIVNVVLDLLFVIVFKMGVFGAAVATVIAQALSSVLLVLYTNRTNPLLRLRLRELHFDLEMFGDILRYGIPSALQQSVVGLGMVGVQGLLNTFGETVIAGYTAATKIDSFISMPFMNISMSLAGFAGQNVGAGKYDRVKQGLRDTLKLVAAVCVIVAAVVIPFSKYLMMIFIHSSELEVIAFGRSYLSIVSACYILLGIMFTFSGLFRGTGDMVTVMFASMISLGIRVFSAYTFSRYIGASALAWSIAVGWLAGSIWGYARYKRGNWMHGALVSTGP